MAGSPNRINPGGGAVEGVTIPNPAYPSGLKIEINGVPVVNDGISITRAPFPDVTKVNIVVANSDIPKVAALQGGYKKPVTLVVSCYNVLKGQVETQEWKNMFVLPREPYNDVMTSFPLVDFAWWYQPVAPGFTFTGRFNMRRDQNDLESLDVQGQVTFRKDRYLAYSIKDDGTPYTALELLDLVMKDIDDRYGVNFYDAGSLGRVKDNKYVPDFREWIRVPAAQLINELMRMAFVGLDKFPETGKCSYYRLDRSSTDGMDNTATVIENAVSVVNNAAKRPSEIDVGFTVNAEVWLKTPPSEKVSATQTTANTTIGDIANSYPYIFNVMPIPTNLSAAAVTQAWSRIPRVERELMGEFAAIWQKSGVTRGTWLPIRAAVEIRAKQDEIDGANDPIAIPYMPINSSLSGSVLNLADIRAGQRAGLNEPIYTRLWFSNMFETLYGIIKPSTQGGAVAGINIWHPVRIAWASALRKHLYVSYRINPKYLETIVSWYPRRAGIVDPVYRVQLPSPIYTQYAVNYRNYPPSGTWKIGSAYDKTLQNKDDTTGLPEGLGTILGRVSNLAKFQNPKVKAIVGGDDAADVIVSPFQMIVIDRELGIFAVQPQEDVEGLVRDIDRANIENINTVALNLDGSVLRMNQYLKSSKTLHTIVTIVPATPNNDSQLYTVVIKPNQAGQPSGNAPPLRIVSTKEVCRIRVDGVVMNELLLADVAQAEAETQYAMTQDRTKGYKVYAGFAKKARLAGFAKSITYTAGPAGIETHHDFTEHPDPPPFYTLVSYETRKLVFRALWGG